MRPSSSQMLIDVNTHKKATEELNASLLERLSGADGSLLDDEALMQVKLLCKYGDCV